jgi:hypothetical protein
MREFTKYNLTEEELAIVNRWPEFYVIPAPTGFVRTYIKRGIIKSDEAVNLRYGFEFDKGWLPIADELGKTATYFVNLLRDSNKQPDAYIKSCIFKEKFGYLENQGDYNLIEPYRSMWLTIERSITGRARSICPVCGNHARFKLGFYMVCDKHAEKINSI